MQEVAPALVQFKGFWRIDKLTASPSWGFLRQALGTYSERLKQPAVETASPGTLFTQGDFDPRLSFLCRAYTENKKSICFSHFGNLEGSL
jgi:hypothetical protein